MRTLARVQAASGVIFAVFLILHLTTTASAVGGPGTYDAVLRSLRLIYRPHPAVEFLLIGFPAGVHIACAILRILRRRRAPEEPPPRHVRVHRWAGYFLLVVIVGHVAATRLLPTLATGPKATGRADFGYLAYSVLGWPAFINPYYVLLGLAGAVHLALGLGIAWRALRIRGQAGEGMRRASVVAATAVAAIILVGVVSIIARADAADRARFPEYRALYERYLPFMTPLRSARVEPPPLK